ncbi:HigA family addiction module antitoxin [Collimonas sp.]|jgi:addiction module HigA family antidote|uniref:HigA family addiction module antitoxin n=1 Tax=Collimonas sp. TaxID=1963772 RepID=UPI002C845253|nr:HigA family addiction module antitoxin [Collimonas sp.]HWW07525.1 HigA family addiction module antitoxin [Collimonas sp.]
MTRKITLATPGEILNQEFLLPMNIGQCALAKAVYVPSWRINEIIEHGRAITPDMALRLGQYFGMSADFWSSLQSRYDLETRRAQMVEELAVIRQLQAD